MPRSPSPPIYLPVDCEGFDLEGRLDGPPGAPGVVVCHPHPAFGGTLDAPLIVALGDALAAAGMRVLRFNFRGIGKSGGQPEGGHAEDRDVRAACAFLRAHNPSPTEIAIAAYSFGALMATKAIALGERARRFAAIGIPTRIIGGDPARVAHVEAALRAVPTLFIGGDRDQFCETDRVRAWCDTVPGTELHLIPGADHFPTGPALDELLRHTVSFLR